MSANQSQLAALHSANRQAAYLTASLQRAILPLFFFFVRVFLLFFQSGSLTAGLILAVSPNSLREESQAQFFPF